MSPEGLVIRPISESDSITELTELLHRAYARLAAMGLRFVATYQDEATTRERISWGECYIAELDGKMVGTISFMPQAGGSDWLDQPGIACFGQFAVEPALQSTGIGAAMLARVEARAKEIGARELALDTSEKALHLIDYYARRGFRHIETVQWEVTNYRSVIMSKTL